jgi:hypothetical protein
MTYCHPVWASTYGWNKVYPNIKDAQLVGQRAASPRRTPATIGSLLVGSIYPSGREDWITVRGAVRPEQLSAVHGVEFVDRRPADPPARRLAAPARRRRRQPRRPAPRPLRRGHPAHPHRRPTRIAVPVHAVKQHHPRRLKSAN